MGSRKFIDASGNIIEPVTRELDAQRIQDIKAVVLQATKELDVRRIQETKTKTLLSIADFRRAHCPACSDYPPKGSCGGGYFSAIAPEVCRTNAEVTEAALVPSDHCIFHVNGNQSCTESIQ